PPPFVAHAAARANVAYPAANHSGSRMTTSLAAHNDVRQPITGESSLEYYSNRRQIRSEFLRRADAPAMGARLPQHPGRTRRRPREARPACLMQVPNLGTLRILEPRIVLMRRIVPLVVLSLLAQACAPSAATPQSPPTAAPPAAALTKAENLPTASAPAPGHAAIVGSFDKPVTSFGATVLSRHVYTLGGYSGTPHGYVREDQSEAFARYDVTTGTWESLPSPGKTQSATLSTFGERIVRVG